MDLQQLLDQPALHHVGIIVRDLDAVIARYRQLGFPAPAVQHLADQEVVAATFAAGPGWVELIMPLVQEGGLVRFLESRGEGIHHVAYAVADLTASLERLRRAGFELIDQQPRVGAHGWRVAFVHPRSCHGVLTELVQAG